MSIRFKNSYMVTRLKPFPFAVCKQAFLVGFEGFHWTCPSELHCSSEKLYFPHPGWTGGSPLEFRSLWLVHCQRLVCNEDRRKCPSIWSWDVLLVIHQLQILYFIFIFLKIIYSFNQPGPAPCFKAHPKKFTIVSLYGDCCHDWSRGG